VSGGGDVRSDPHGLGEGEGGGGNVVGSDLLGKEV
jgi:hypothetical protein